MPPLMPLEETEKLINRVNAFIAEFSIDDGLNLRYRSDNITRFSLNVTKENYKKFNKEIVELINQLTLFVTDYRKYDKIYKRKMSKIYNELVFDTDSIHLDASCYIMLEARREHYRIDSTYWLWKWGPTDAYMFNEQQIGREAIYFLSVLTTAREYVKKLIWL